MKKIIQHLKPNMTIKETLLLTRIEEKLGKNGPYLEMIVRDASGEMIARKWDITEKDYQLLDFISHELPKVVLIKGVTRQFRNMLDLKVFYIVLPEEPINMHEFIPCAPIESNKAFETIEQALGKIQNQKIHTITSDIYQIYKPFLIQYPASSYHHEMYGGLLWHIENTIELAKKILQLYPDLFQYDLLIAGAILHDLAKVKDYDVKNGVIVHVTDHAKLIGHIVRMANEVRECARRNQIPINSVEVELLEHMILSHHGKGENGSPVEPQLPEAVALYLIDMLDTKIGGVYQLVQMTKSGEWSNWSPLLGTKIKKVQL